MMRDVFRARPIWKPVLAVILLMLTTTVGKTGAGTDTLWSDEQLGPDEYIQAGGTKLVYQGDNNLVLNQNGSPIWSTSLSVNSPAVSFVMQSDCNAVIYHQVQNITTGQWSTVSGWSSRTNNQGGGCFARVIEGDWFICNGQTRIWSARGGGSCDDGVSCPVTGYVNQQQTTEDALSIQYPFNYCSTTGSLPASCSYYCAYLGFPNTPAALDVKFLKGTRTIRTGVPQTACGQTLGYTFVISDDVQMSGNYCWTLFPNNSCVDQYWRNPESPRC